MLHWMQLVDLPEAELRRIDIAAANLACAAGLPDARDIDIDRCLTTLDEWAKVVRWRTNKKMRRYDANPPEFANSRNYFRVLCMVTVLQRELGLRYNPAKIPVDVPFVTADLFIHGAVLGDGGTCATLPVVYAAVGRRLGYPIKLVSTRGAAYGHIFARWDEPGACFNIEATARGLSTPPDDHYRTGLYAFAATHEEDGLFLRSKTPRQELAEFVAQNGLRWLDFASRRNAVEALAWAAALSPENVALVNRLKLELARWTDHVEVRKPPRFPETFITLRGRTWPATLPYDLERCLRGLSAVQFMLDDPTQERQWWQPARLGRHPAHFPIRAEARFQSSKYYISFILPDAAPETTTAPAR